MRTQLTIFCLALVFIVAAQRKVPIALSNSYQLSESDGFPGNNYTRNYMQLPSGLIYARDFYGNFHHTGNNFWKNIQGSENLSNSTNFLYRGNNEIWLFDGRFINIYKGDSLKSVYKYPDFNFLDWSIGNSNDIFIFKEEHGRINIYKFDDYHWKNVNSFFWNEKFKYPFENVNSSKSTFAAERKNNKIGVYEFDSLKLNFIFKKIISAPKNVFIVNFYDKNWNLNEKLIKEFSDFYKDRSGHNFYLDLLNQADFENRIYNYGNHLFAYNHQNGINEIFKMDSTGISASVGFIEEKEKVNSIVPCRDYPYYTLLTNNKPIRIFPYIWKYPKIYNDDNSSNIFVLIQDKIGRIWAGNYQNKLSILSKNTIASNIIEKEDKSYYTNNQFKNQPFAFMNASLVFEGDIYLVGETMNGGILKFNNRGVMKQLSPKTYTGYYLYLAPKGKRIYFATAKGSLYPVISCDIKEFKKPYINWKTLDSSSGIKNFGMASMTEDSMGRVWMGHPKKGFAVYNPKTEKGETFDVKNNESPIGFISSLTDNNGTVWMGSDNNGLWYYNDYYKPATSQNIHRLDHPLLNQVKRITGMTIYQNWLVLCCYNKVCLLDLDEFHNKKKVVLRYLNPQEAALTSTTEQNTIITSKTDSTIWFNTADMVYQWDIGQWLQIPTYRVSLKTFINIDGTRVEARENEPLKIKAGSNSFDIMFEYLSPDALPRYTRTVLVKEGDKVQYEEPDLKSKFNFKNLTNGSYTFLIQVFEQDGSISQYNYPILVMRHIWQEWWLWVALSLLFFLPVLLWLNSLRKHAIQQKRIGQLSVVSLSNQFRPHFILNALNTVGADLNDKPQAESIISRLGESINLIFNQSRQKKVTTSLHDEWQLVLNVIEINKMMYLPQLQVQLPKNEWLNINGSIKLPIGILEVIVENALLHGLRNRKEAPYLLIINIEEDDSKIRFIVKDNGIGRDSAMKLSSYKKHGTGTKNLFEIIEILNKYNISKIEIKFFDFFMEEAGSTGTTVEISIPKNYHYEY